MEGKKKNSKDAMMRGEISHSSILFSSVHPAPSPPRPHPLPSFSVPFPFPIPSSCRAWGSGMPLTFHSIWVMIILNSIFRRHALQSQPPLPLDRPKPKRHRLSIPVCYFPWTIPGVLLSLFVSDANALYEAHVLLHQ